MSAGCGTNSWLAIKINKHYIYCIRNPILIVLLQMTDEKAPVTLKLFQNFCNKSNFSF